MSYIIYPQSDSKLAVLYPCMGVTKTVEIEVQVPVIGEDGNPTGETNTVTREEQVPMSIEEIAAKDVPADTPFKIVDSLDIDNDYFNAYDFSEESGAEVNIDKAKALHLDKFRSARAPKLTSLDVAFMRAVEQSDSAKQAEIAEAKQELRDVTKVELPETLEEIKAVWPDILN